MNVFLTNPVFFKNGEKTGSAVVGYESKTNRVARYDLVPPDIGANGINIRFLDNWKGNGTIPETLGVFIGTSPDEYSNAGFGSETTTILTRESGTYNYVGYADIVIIPNITYYVWVFPLTTTFGWLYWSKTEGSSVIETSGGAISSAKPAKFSIGKENTIEIIRYISKYTQTLRYSIGSASGTIVEKTPYEFALWTPDINLCGQIVDSTIGSATVYVDTYDDDRLIGTSEVTFELVVPEDVVPSVSATWVSKGKAEDLFGEIVQNVSCLEIMPLVVGAYGSWIKKIEIFLNGKAYYGSVVTEYGDVTLTVVATDSRGREADWSEILSVFRYEFPKVSISASRCDEDGTPNEVGEYASIVISSVTYDINNSNQVVANLTYGEKTQSIDINTGVKSTVVIVESPSVSSMPISCVVTDLLGSSDAVDMTLSVGYATLDFLAGGKGIAFGTTAKQEGFTCAMPAEFAGSVTLQGGVLADHVVEVDEKDGWNYRLWASGISECWCFWTENVSVASPYGNGFFNGAGINKALPSGLFTSVNGLQLTAWGFADAQIYIPAVVAAGPEAFAYYITSMNVQNPTTVGITAHVMGQWK